MALGVSRSEVDAVRFARFDHAVGLFERDAHRLLAEDTLDARLDGRQNDLGYDRGWEDGRRYVDLLVGEHLTIVGVSTFETEPSPEQLEDLGVLLRHGNHLGPGIELVGAGVLRALQTRPDDSDAVWRCHLLSPHKLKAVCAS